MGKNLVKTILREQFKNIIKEATIASDLESFIVDSIDLSAYDKDNLTGDEAVKALYDIFVSERGYLIKQKGVRKTLEDYLRGMPSTIDLPIYYTDIRNFLYSIGFNEAKDMDDKEIDKLYYTTMVDALINMFKRVN